MLKRNVNCTPAVHQCKNSCSLFVDLAHDPQRSTQKREAETGKVISFICVHQPLVMRYVIFVIGPLLPVFELDFVCRRLGVVVSTVSYESLILAGLAPRRMQCAGSKYRSRSWWLKY